jgi:hypothetical protein
MVEVVVSAVVVIVESGLYVVRYEAVEMVGELPPWRVYHDHVYVVREASSQGLSLFGTKP